jgi:hypothetical protein
MQKKKEEHPGSTQEEVDYAKNLELWGIIGNPANGQTEYATMLQREEFIVHCTTLSPGYSWHISVEPQAVQRDNNDTPSCFHPLRHFGEFQAVGIRTGCPVRYAKQIEDGDDFGSCRLKIWDDSRKWLILQKRLASPFSEVDTVRDAVFFGGLRLIDVLPIPVGMVEDSWFAV